MSTYTYGRDIAEDIAVSKIAKLLAERRQMDQARSDRRYFYGEDISGVRRIIFDGLNVSVTREPRSIFDRRVKNASGQWEYC